MRILGFPRVRVVCFSLSLLGTGGKPQGTAGNQARGLISYAVTIIEIVKIPPAGRMLASGHGWIGS